MGCEAPWKVTGSFLEIVPLEGPLVGSAKSARIRRCRMTFVELVHLCNMVERCSRASTSESAVFSENADPFRQRAIAGGRGPGGRFGRFRYLVESVQPAHLSRWSWHYRQPPGCRGRPPEASLKAYRAIAEFQGKSRFYSWLVRIAVNVALGKLKEDKVKSIFAR